MKANFKTTASEYRNIGVYYFLRSMRKFVILSKFLLVICIAALAQDETVTTNDFLEVIQTVAEKSTIHYDAPSDTSHVEIRLPTVADLDKFRNDSEFNYSREIQYEKTLWGLIGYYIAKFFSNLYEIEGSGNWMRWLWIGLLSVVAVFGLIKMFGVDMSGIFFSKPPPPVDLSDMVIDEHVDRNKLGAMLEKALEEKQYRLAVRLTYLIVLRRLSDAGQIHWQADKTNRSYLNEISNQTLRQSFANLTHLYEYVWYGDFDINAGHYRDIEADFNELSRRL